MIIPVITITVILVLKRYNSRHLSAVILCILYIMNYPIVQHFKTPVSGRCMNKDYEHDYDYHHHYCNCYYYHYMYDNGDNNNNDSDNNHVYHYYYYHDHY